MRHWHFLKSTCDIGIPNQGHQHSQVVFSIGLNLLRLLKCMCMRDQDLLIHDCITHSFYHVSHPRYVIVSVY